MILVKRVEQYHNCDYEQKSAYASYAKRFDKFLLCHLYSAAFL